jgi:hypothetical protein
MAGPIDPRTLAIIRAMEPAAAQRQAIMARDAVMRGPAPAPMNPVFRPGMDAAPVMPAGLTIAPQGGMPPGFDEFADVRNPIPQPRGPMTAPQPSAADLMPPPSAGQLQPMPQSFETPIGPAPSRFVPPPMPAPAGNMLAPDIETGSVTPAPAPAPVAPPAGNRLEAPMPAPIVPGRRVYDPAAGTNQPRFIYEGGPAPMPAAGGGSAIATGGGAVPATGGAGAPAAAPASAGGSGFGDGFMDFLGGFSRGGLLGGIQGIQLGKQARAKAGQTQQGINQTIAAARRMGIPDDMVTALTATGNTKALVDVMVDIQKQNMRGAEEPTLTDGLDAQGRKVRGYMRDGRFVQVGGAEAQEVKPGWRDLTPEEIEARRLDPSKPWQVSPEGKLDTPGSSGVSITNQVGGERAYDTAIGTFNAETFKSTQAAGSNAGRTIATLNRLEALTSDPNFYSGAGGETVTEFKKIIGALGGDPNAAAPNEEFVATTNRLILDASGGTLGAAVSNADRDFLTNTAPNISTTAEGNRQRIEVARRLAKRDQEVAQLARDYVKQNGRIDDGFREMLSQYGEANPLFANMPTGAPEAGGAGGQFQEGTVAEDDNGNRIIFQGGKWVPQ